MKLVIDDRFYVDVDTHNYTLKEITGKNEKGEDTTRTHGHFMQLTYLIDYMARLNVISDNDELTIVEYVKALEIEVKSLRRVLNE